MSIESDAGADAGGTDLAETQEDLTTQTVDDGGEGGESTDASQPEGEEKAEQEKALAPLPPDEIEKRWKQTKGALKETRNELRAWRNKVAELEAKVSGVQPAAKQVQAQDVPPDPNVDPHGAMAWIINRVNQNDQREQEQAEGRKQYEAQQREVQTVVTGVNEFERDFREEKPDYDEAVGYLRSTRQAELQRLGYPEHKALEMVNREVFHAAAQLLKNGVDPARYAYEIASQRGYKPKGAAKQDNEAPAEGVLDKIVKGQEAAKTIGNGGKAGGELSIENVSKLSGAAFDGAFKKLMEQEQERERRLG